MQDNSIPMMLLDDSFYPGVLDGTITATIRIGDRPMQQGRMMFQATNGGYLPLMVYATSIIHTTLIGIADIHAQRAGYQDSEHAIEALKEFYPEAKLDTPMTVVLFERVY